MADSYEKTMLKLEQMAQNTNAQQMNWQEKMSNTSHQREVKDLIAAGINPVLSANQGAQSYTTTLDSAVSAVGNLASAKQGADATRYAARQSAAATRAAAAANLAAAREAAAASRYAADQQYKSTKYSVDNSKTGSFAGILDNFRKSTKTDNTGIGKSMSNLWKQLNKDPKYFFKNPNSRSFNTLNASGRNIIQKSLRKMGVSVTLPNQQVAYRALFEGNKSDQKKMAAWMRSFNKKASSAKRVWSSKTGSGIW